MKPRILFLDIETAPASAYCWGLFDQNISLEQIIAPGRIICWAAKWLGNRQLLFADERGGVKKMLAPIHKALCEADAVCTYNGDRFDLEKLDGAFLENGFPPVPQPTSIDLLKTVKKLGYQSSKLAYVGPHLGIGAKVATGGFALWRGCMNGDEAAWKKMITYNKQDVRLLERLYKVMRPYVRNHPTLGAGGDACPACQSRNTQNRGVRRTRSFIIQRVQCQDCGGWFNGKRTKA